MNRPWMPLYVADYLADTAHLNAAQSGAYLHLIMHYWQTGNLPDDDAALARIARMTGGEWKKARPIIAPFFSPDWKHKRIDSELAKAADISSKRRASAEQRYNKSGANASANAEQTNTHAGCDSDSGCSSEGLSEVSEPRARTNNTELEREFDVFYQQFPRHEGRGHALKAYRGARKTVEATVLFEGATRARERYRDSDPKFIPLPATWLHGQRWLDEVTPEKSARAEEFKKKIAEYDEFYRGVL